MGRAFEYRKARKLKRWGHMARVFTKIGKEWALITGGDSGIGRAVALELASHGYDLAVNYHSNEKAAREVCDRARAMGVRAEPVYADMGKVEDIAAMYA